MAVRVATSIRVENTRETVVVDPSVVQEDTRGAVHRWQRAISQVRGARPVSDRRIVDPRDNRIDSCVARAIALLRGADLGISTPITASFCVVTKSPHVASPTSVACLVSRLLAFGVEVNRLAPVEDARQAASVLYPRAWRYYCGSPDRVSHWQRLATQFDNGDFVRIFGRRYSPDLVVPGAEVVRANGLLPYELTAIWEEGRRPIARPVVARRYGASVANLLLGGNERYDWFRGDYPIGVHRVAPGLVAFAMRHERVNGGRPAIVLNGHAPGLTALFGPGTTIIDLGLRSDGPDIGEVRQWLAGDDNRPSRCRPGTLRRDAVDHRFPVDSEQTPTSRYNLLHCSDGLLAGLLEVQRLMPAAFPNDNLLAHALREQGLTDDEITSIVHADPLVQTADRDTSLTEATRGLALDECTQTLRRLVPPVFGADNGYADGLRMATFVRSLDRSAFPVRISGTPAPPATELRYPEHVLLRPDDLTAAHETAGRTAIAEGRVAMIVPAGGTGGRFGGYDHPEDHPARQKSLVQVFELRGRKVSSLDVRLANNRYWAAGNPDRIPMAVMAAPTNVDLIRAWRESLGAPGARAVSIYQQHGVYRMNTRLLAPGSRNWADAVLRGEDGAPSLKPPGNLGQVTCLLLSGIFQRWRERGIEIIATANGDDVGFRLDPRIVGHLCLRPDIDAVVVGVPWGFSGTRFHRGHNVEVRGDVSGWTVDETREGEPIDLDEVSRSDPLVGLTFDRGGAIGESDGRVRIIECEGPPPLASSVPFNTNQMYLRVSALQALLDNTGSTDVAEAVRRLRDGQPLYVERKHVLLDGRTVESLQVFQTVNDLVPRLRMSAVLLASRHIAPGTRGGYQPLKRPSDLLFAQILLDCLQRIGDELELV